MEGLSYIYKSPSINNACYIISASVQAIQIRNLNKKECRTSKTSFQNISYLTKGGLSSMEAYFHAD